MDEARFDQFARALGAGRTRRGAVGLLAGVAGLVVASAAEAKRPKAKRAKATSKHGPRGKPTGNGTHGKNQPAAPQADSAVCAAAGARTCPLAQAQRGACACAPDYVACPHSGCQLTCDRRSSFYAGRFLTCLGSGNTCDYCTGWMDCVGTVDTGTACGTVTAECCNLTGTC